MLSLSQTSNSLFCIEWIPSGTGPKVINYKKIPANFHRYNNFLDAVFNEFNVENNDDAHKVLTLSLNIDDICITSFKYDSNIALEEKIIWYEKSFLGKYIIENHDVYYYPIVGNDNEVMVIYISKELKNNILESCNKYGYDLQHLTIDIFSANHAVHIYNYSKTDNYILWKIGKGKQHYLLYYEKTALKHYLNFKSGKKIECIQSIGEKSLRDDLIKLVDSFLNSDKNIDNKFYDKIYLYQSKSNVQLLKKISNKDNVIIMEIGSKLFNKNNNYNLLTYNENGNSLRGIDV